ncbi:MAG: hypothetical protein ACTSQJ_08085 [Promethearchaeota archaeon]
MNSKKYSRYILIFIFMICITFPLIPNTIGQQEEESKEFEGTMISEDEDTTTDDEWQWYKCVVDLGEEVTVELNYKGDLDLDMRLYWKRENFPEFNGFDLTHCSVNDDKYNYSGYSQFRTTDTYELGQPEELYFTNPSYTKKEDKEAYILVYVHSGKGESEFIIESTHKLTLIDDNAVYDCNFVFTIFLFYLAAVGTVFGIYVFIVLRKKKKITRPEKEEIKPKKEKKELETIDLDSQL